MANTKRKLLPEPKICPICKLSVTTTEDAMKHFGRYYGYAKHCLACREKRTKERNATS